MNREEKQTSRGILFRHLDGIAIGPTVSALYKGGIIEYILNHPNFSFQELSNEWWDPNGKFKILHTLTPLRIKYIINKLKTSDKSSYIVS